MNSSLNPNNLYSLFCSSSRHFLFQGVVFCGIKKVSLSVLQGKTGLRIDGVYKSESRIQIPIIPDVTTWKEETTLFSLENIQ